jgi:hypothetical protein
MEDPKLTVLQESVWGKSMVGVAEKGVTHLINTSA